MRTDSVIKNGFFALFAQILTVLLKMMTRVVFVKLLSVEYLGINGLFSNVLSMLSLAELGVGSAILYNMYGPMAQKNQIRVKALMNFYKEAYIRIGFLILIIGLSLTPFLGHFIKDQPNIDNLHIIYVLYIINNTVSYFFVYKQSVFFADQKNYIVTKANIIRDLVTNIGQILFLMLTRNFLIYLFISIISTLLFNIMISIIADKKYPFLIHNRERLEGEEKRVIYKDVYAMMAHKVGGVIVSGTDNLLISTFVGVVAVGIYSNYVLILSSVKGFLNQLYEALMSSIGNLVNTEKKERVYDIYCNLLFISFWITSLISIGFYCLANPLIDMMFGEEYLLDKNIVAIIAFNFFVTDLTGMRAITNKFKTAYGLFWNDRYKSYLESSINLIASILLLKYYGFVGILLGTLISTLTTAFWIEPYVLYRYGFTKKIKEYYEIYFEFILIYFLSWAICGYLLNSIKGIQGIMIGAMTCILVPSGIITIVYRKRKNYRYLIGLIKRILRKVVRRNDD